MLSVRNLSVTCPGSGTSSLCAEVELELMESFLRDAAHFTPQVRTVCIVSFAVRLSDSLLPARDFSVDKKVEGLGGG